MGSQRVLAAAAAAEPSMKKFLCVRLSVCGVWKTQVTTLVRPRSSMSYSTCKQSQATCFSQKTQLDGMGREEGGGFRRGSTCIPVMDSF